MKTRIIFLLILFQICGVGLIGVSEGAVIVTDGMNWLATFWVWSPAESTYLYKAIGNDPPNYWRDTIKSRDGVIVPFSWTNDVFNTGGQGFSLHYSSQHQHQV